MLKELYEIDLSGHGSDRRLRAALQDGFFFVRNTVPESLLDDAYQLLEAFFALPAEVKQECRVPGSNGQSGFTPPLVETAEKGRVPDWKELFHWGVRLPEDHPLRVRYPSRYPQPLLPEALVPGIDAVLTELHTRMLAFQHEVAAEIGRSLGLPAQYFAELLQDGPVVNRATWYPPMQDAPSQDHVWAVEHQDFDLITALPRATAGGLQVQAEDGSWLPVDAPAGYAVVNVGMVLERLTGGLARAAVHRVVAEPGQSGGRLSIVQFCHPAPWTVLTPLRIPGEEERASRFPTLTADDLFQRTMYRINRLDSRGLKEN
ncbi:2-oxoglutarate and iron-dependent oxygenase domain-containing protein [Kitasatospora sp. GP82]|uniref:isopenicillin N synthase family dioxygenase n=1 Tax=Kitasatospora sp. GP82 TaxID=3035089 RepID=UPI00247558F1|nr:2-oxoglutarate and iron-dependent oxygenase domain-containing protein [Kitasatospora sp. GP82]MDH6129704.1 isopenicillin N synthase-like dioxygenase [Kitasatospora sp. GP82]